MTEDELDEALGAYETPAPPSGFADRVIAATEAPEPASPKRAPWLIGGAMAAAAAVAVALAWPAGPVEGALEANAREEVSLGPRGVAVAEPGAALSWRADDATATIEQSAGDVFYRAEPSERFVVHTPAGDVEVRGTCFRVEVLDMNVSPQLFVGAAAGAALSAAVLVTVYEGSVEAQNAHGAVTLAPGEASVLSPEAAPSAPRPSGELHAETRPEAEAETADAPSADEIAAMDPETLRARLSAMSARDQEQAHEIARLRGLLDDADLQSDARNASFFPASDEQLRQWADNCQLRLDQPPVMGMEAGEVGDAADQLELTPEERDAVQQAIERMHGSVSEELRELYVEATGDTHGAAQLSPRAMFAEIRDKAGEDDTPSIVMNRIAQERAGLAMAPAADAEMSAPERATRLYAGVGDRFQQLLAEALGPQRAYDLRAREGGWPWAHSIFSGCPSEE